MVEQKHTANSPGLPCQEANLTEVGRKLQRSQPQSFTICPYMPQTMQSHPRSSEKKTESSAAAENRIALSSLCMQVS